MLHHSFVTARLYYSGMIKWLRFRFFFYSYSVTSVAGPHNTSRSLSIPECHEMFQANCRAWRAGSKDRTSDEGGRMQQKGLTAWWVAGWNGMLYLGEGEKCHHGDENFDKCNVFTDCVANHLCVSDKGREKGVRATSVSSDLSYEK